MNRHAGVDRKPATLEFVGHIELPGHIRPGGFDHAAVHRGTARLYVAHTANDAVDVIDCASDRYLHSIAGLTGVAGVLVSEQQDLVFTSNRGEDSVGIFCALTQAELARVAVGVRPNGLAHDHRRNRLLAANVGDPARPKSFTASVVDVARRERIAEIPMPGRTRWAVYDARRDVFFVNIADPARIVVIPGEDPVRIVAAYDVPATGPHGLDLDPERGRLFCACDAARLVCLDADSGQVLDELELSGAPDVVFLNRALAHLYVAIGDPGLIDVIDTRAWQRIESIPTEKGAHTLGFDPDRNKVYAFLPGTHRAAVYRDGVDRRSPQ
ncbi:MAG: YncE family protein [Nitrospirae bacterium]|nr:YncE family protein [Nitrospirota bacterium]